MDLRRVRPAAHVAFLLAVATAIVAQSAPAEAAADAAAEKPTPVTTADPAIPVDQLELLVKPLTTEELVVEADAWRDLLKKKVQQISQLQIAVKQHDAAAEEASASVQKQQPEAQAKEADEAQAVADRKQSLAETLPELQEDRANLVDRLGVVIAALEKKGGKVEAYRQYVSAISGLDIDVTDAATSWTLIKGWLASEQGGQRWAWNLGKFFVILIAFYFAASIASRLVRHAASRIEGASQLLTSFLGKFVKQVIMLIGLIVALAALEVNIGPLLAAVGAAGFVIAFALQDTLSNFASGLLILAYRPFDVGDVIEAGGVAGSVRAVSLFSTHIATPDNKMMIVPNNDIWGGTITNATASDTRRVDMTFGIGYEDDIEKAKGILEGLLKEHKLVLEDPPPVVQMHELADSSVNFICRPWTETANYWTVYWDITQAVKEAFDHNGISIPFPQRDVHVHREAGSTGEPLPSLETSV